MTSLAATKTNNYKVNTLKTSPSCPGEGCRQIDLLYLQSDPTIFTRPDCFLASGDACEL